MACGTSGNNVRHGSATAQAVWEVTMDAKLTYENGIWLLELANDSGQPCYLEVTEFEASYLRGIGVEVNAA
jgi:hypothetical protein